MAICWSRIGSAGPRYLDREGNPTPAHWCDGDKGPRVWHRVGTIALRQGVKWIRPAQSRSLRVRWPGRPGAGMAGTSSPERGDGRSDRGRAAGTLTISASSCVPSSKASNPARAIDPGVRSHCNVLRRSARGLLFFVHSFAVVCLWCCSRLEGDNLDRGGGRSVEGRSGVERRAPWVGDGCCHRSGNHSSCR